MEKNLFLNLKLKKTKLCRNFESNGFCSYGLNCHFAHGKSELQTKSSNYDSDYDTVIYNPKKYKTKICKNYKNNGTCSYGSRCRFAHGISELTYDFTGYNSSSDSSNYLKDRWEIDQKFNNMMKTYWRNYDDQDIINILEKVKAEVSSSESLYEDESCEYNSDNDDIKKKEKRNRIVKKVKTLRKYEEDESDKEEEERDEQDEKEVKEEEEIENEDGEDNSDFSKLSKKRKPKTARKEKKIHDRQLEILKNYLKYKQDPEMEGFSDYSCHTDDSRDTFYWNQYFNN